MVANLNIDSSKFLLVKGQEMKKMILAAAAAVSMALPATANAAADVTVNFGATNPVPASNDFQSLLSGLGLTRFATTGASLVLNGPALITFYFMGSESGFNDTFSTSTLSLTENTLFTNNFAGGGTLIGSQVFAGGSLAGLLNFTTTNANGASATVGQDGFGIFLGANQVSGSNFTTLYFGYDDEIRNQDDNHDDFIVRAVIQAVPEPATWAMMIAGFGLVGGAMRLRRREGEMAAA